MEMSTITTDAVREEEGVWVKFGDATVLIASKSSDRYKKIMQRLFKPHEANFALDLLADDVAKDIAYRGMAEGICLNWKGFTEKGVEVPYSPEKAYQYIIDVRPFRSFLDAESEKISNYKTVKEEIEVKNS